MQKKGFFNALQNLVIFPQSDRIWCYYGILVISTFLQIFIVVVNTDFCIGNQTITE